VDEGSDNEMRGFVVECNRRRSIWYRATVHITAIRKGIVADQIERARRARVFLPFYLAWLVNCL